MAFVHTMQTSFLAGEVSPRYLGNTNTEEYKNALRHLENGYVLSQGGIQKRPGSQVVDYSFEDLALESTSSVLRICYDWVNHPELEYRIIKYKTSDGKKWWLILNNAGITAWTVLDVDNGVLYPLSGDPTRTTPTTNGVFGYNQWANATYTTLFHGTTIPYPVINVDISEIQYEQTGDVLVLVHRSLPPITIRYEKTTHYDLTPANNFFLPCARVWHVAFMPTQTAIVDNLEYQQTMPLLEFNQDNNNGLGGITIPAGALAVGGSLNLTSTLGIFTSDWVYTAIRLTDLTGAQSGLFYITGYTSSTTVTATLIAGVKPSSALTYGVSADTYWEESAWSPKNGYPSTVVAYGGRLLYMGSFRNPNRIWCSAVGDIDQLCEVPFAQNTAAYSGYLDDPSRAFSIDIIGAEQIRWANVGKRIFIGANNKEFVLYSPDQSFSPDSYRIDTATTVGSAYRQALRSSSEILFTQRSGQRLRSIVFSFQEDDYKTQDLTRLADHIVRESFPNNDQVAQRIPQFEDVALQNSPEPRLWLTDSNGGLLSCTFDRESGVVAWSKHYLGGTPIAGSDYPYVSAITVDESYDKTSDEVVMLVKRQVSGIDMVHLEKIGPYFNLQEYTHEYFNPLAGYPDAASARAIFLDHARLYVPVSPATTYVNADLSDEEVSVVADGVYLGEYTFSGTTLTVPVEFSELIVGYKYGARIVTVDYEVPGSPSSNIGKHKIAYETKVGFNRTHGCKVRKYGQTDWQTLQFVTDAAPADGPVPLFTGYKEVRTGGIGEQLSLELYDDSPFPFEVIGLVFKVFME